MSLQIDFAGSVWRRERDSNPREIALKRISSAPRYDRFDTSANIGCQYKKATKIIIRGFFIQVKYFQQVGIRYDIM